MRQRVRVISRIIAVAMLCLGVKSLWEAFMALIRTKIAISATLIFEVLLLVLVFAFSYICLHLAWKFWRQPTEKDIGWLAWVGAFLVFGGVAVIFRKLELSNAVPKYFPEEYMFLLNGISTFISLCAAGIGFMCIKKAVSWLLEISIQEDWSKRVKARKTFFAVSAFFLWTGLGWGLSDFNRKINPSGRFSGYEIIVILGTLVAAIVFYYVCISIFCKRKSNTNLSG
jgi:hypothetical protein